MADDSGKTRRTKRRRQPSNRFADHLRPNHNHNNDSLGKLEELQLDIEDIQQDMVVLDSKEESASRKIELLSAIVSKQYKMNS